MQSSKVVLKNAQVFMESGFETVDIEIENGCISKIETDIACDNILDLEGKIISPGFVDPHVHLREPGFTKKEDIASGTLSAIKGGYTHVMAMPNTNPCMDDVNTIQHFNSLVTEKANCNVKTFSAISKELMGEELVDFKAISKLDIAGFSDDGKGVQTEEKMLETLKIIEDMDTILSLHCEDEAELGEEMGSVNLGVASKRHNLVGINNASEWKMVKRDLDLMFENKLNPKYHVCHASTRETIDLIKLGKERGQDVSCEVTPHHLILTDEDISLPNPNFKMNPPLRAKADQQRLIKGLNEGEIEIIATDHAPHAEFEKERGIVKGPFGIIGLDTAFSLLYTYLVKPGKVELETILKAMTYNPAKRFEIKDYGIKVGMAANLTVLDLGKSKIYTKENMGSKASNTPFINQELQATVEMTIVNGRVHNWGE